MTRDHINTARKNMRDSLRPQVAATIYGGMLANVGLNKSSDEIDALMMMAIADAERLLLKLYPTMD